MTEWELQRELTRGWLGRNGLSVDGQRLMLVAWEVMVPSWAINSPSGRWNEPSLDFLLADEEMNLVVVELKRAILGEVPAWRVLCQVSHRAVKVSKTATTERLEHAWRHCRSQSSKAPGGPIATSLLEEHRIFFSLEGRLAPSMLDKRGFDVKRVVAAQKFGRQWPGTLEAFNSLGPDDLRHILQRMRLPKANRDIGRFLDLSPDEFVVRTTPVTSITVDIHVH